MLSGRDHRRGTSSVVGFGCGGPGAYEGQAAGAATRHANELRGEFCAGGSIAAPDANVDARPGSTAVTPVP